MADEFMAQLAQLTGLQHYPRQGPFGLKDGAVIGERNGYLIAIGPRKENKNRIGMLIRFQNLDQPDMLKTAVSQDQTIQKAMGEGIFKAKMSDVQFGNDFLVFDWGSTRRPKAENVAALASAFADVVRHVAPKFEGRCETCRGSQAEMLLADGVPSYYCASCLEKVQQDLNTAAMAYEALPTNFVKGTIYGVAAALAGSIAWGVVAYLLNRIFALGAIGIGGLVGVAVSKGMGKVNLGGKVLTVVLTLASVLFGDAIFFALSVMKEQSIPFSMDLLVAVMTAMPELEAEDPVSLVFALIGAGYVLFTMRRPRFQVRFERLGQAS